MGQADEAASAVAREKTRLRSHMRAVRTARDATDRAAAGTALAEVLLDAPELRAATVVACTIAMPGEPPTSAVIEGLRARGVTVIVPRIEPDRRLSWHELDDATTWRRHPYGIDEPAGEPRPQGLADVDVVLVPALAVGRDGCRLGQGGGYYDRALAATDAALIAVVFDDEVLEAVPCEPHDLRVTAIATPSRLLPV